MTLRRRSRTYTDDPVGYVLELARYGLTFIGVGLIFVASLILRATDGEDPVSQALGRLGLGAFLLAFGASTVASFRTAAAADLPEAVGSRRLASTRALEIRMGVTLALGIGLPVAAVVAVCALTPTGWVFVVIALAFGAIGLGIDRSMRAGRDGTRRPAGPEITVALERLCMRADMPAPAVVIDTDQIPTAWTSAGRVHLTTALLEQLDEHEVEGVIAHEVAHLAHRDAAVMDVATAPSKMLFGVVSAVLLPDYWPADSQPDLLQKVAIVIFGLFYLPVALALGWCSRLLVLSLSRARELSADAAAATLTGRPAALASALTKLDPSGSGTPRTDLRAIEALCIVEVRPSRWGRLLHTHPPIRDRVARLEAMERRLQSPSGSDTP
jgi:heat shock protein HtpX